MCFFFWIDLAQDRDQWRALLNTIMNLRVPQNAGKFLNTQNYWGFGLFPSSGALGSRNTTFRKLDLFPSLGEEGRRHLLSWAP
jgi:hypothetical protein